MSRIGKQPVQIPDGVTVTVDGQNVKVIGSKGELEQDLRHEISVKVEENQVVLTRNNDSKNSKALHGLYRALIANMIIGVTEGFKKELELVGVGYRAKTSPTGLQITVGFSHPVDVEKPEGIDFEVEEQKKITVSGIDKALVGQVAANIRKLRPPEPYKGKGIKYVGEYVRRKAGKAGKVAA